MRGVKRLGWVMLAALTLGAQPHAAPAADKTDKALEERVRALEKRLDQQQKGDAAEKKTVSQRIEAIEQEVKASQKSVAEKMGVTMHGLVAVDYLYDINRPDSGPPFLRSFENEKNSFILNLANLHFERQPESGLGFVADLDFGRTADVVNNTTYFGGSRSSLGNGTDFFDARQFFLTYTVPVGSGIKLKAGRMVTLHGAEVIKAYNNQNYNITNSILFGFSIPFTHTGIMGTYAFNDTVTLDLGLVNGWDNVADQNDGKSLHGGLNLAIDPRFTIYFSGTYGAEQPNNGRSKRLMLTTLITAKPTDQLTLIVDHNYGNESDLVPRGGLLRTAQWHGAAGYVIYAFTDDLSAALRAEIFDDMDGARTVFQEPGFGPGATYWEFTPTITYKITDGLFWRNEYRHDEADKRAFPREDHFVRGQDTLATELIYTF